MTDGPADLAELFAQARYGQVLEAASGLPLDTDGRALVGISALRAARYEVAAEYLRAAAGAGHLEAAVEYGNLLRLTGHLREAHAHLLTLDGRVEGELQWRLSRWLGVTEVQLGSTSTGGVRLEAVAGQYQAAGMFQQAALVSQQLGTLAKTLGQLSRAAAQFERALELLPAAAPAGVRLPVQRSLLDVLIQLGQVHEAGRVAKVALDLLVPGENRRAEAYLACTLAELERLRGNHGGYVLGVRRGGMLARGLGEPQLTNWLAEHEALLACHAGNHDAALRVIDRARAEGGQWTATLRIMRAVVWAGQGEVGRATLELRHLTEESTVKRNVLLRVRAALLVFHLLREQREPDAALAALRELLAVTGRVREPLVPALLFSDLPGVVSSVRWAASLPEFAPHLRPVLTRVEEVRALVA